MEIKFNKKPLSCMQQILTQVQSQEQTQELRLPEGYPDIGKLLGCWGQVVLRGKEWRRTALGANGGVMAWVMYAPEDGTEPRILDAWLPFQCRWDLQNGTEDGVMTVLPLLSDLEGRNISARKIMLRAGVDLLAQAMTKATAELATAEEVPGDVQLLTKHYPAELPVEAGERQVLLDENISLPAELPGITHIVSFELLPQIAEQKVIANRLVFRGIAKFVLRYLSEDGKLNRWTYEMPFSDYTELEQDYDITATAWLLPVVTALETDLQDNRQLQLRGALAVQYTILDRMLLPVTEDAYSPGRDVTVHTEPLALSALLDRRELDLPITTQIDMDAQRIEDVVVRNKHPYLAKKDHGVSVNMTGSCQILYQDADGGLASENVRFEQEMPFACEDDLCVGLWQTVQQQPEYMQSVHDVTVKSRAVIAALSYSGSAVPMVTGLALGEGRKADPNRPSLILKRAGQEDLWHMAKSCGSTVEAIRAANQLTEEPEEGAMLLIPVCG